MEEPRVILNGTKIIVITIGNTKFIDSVNYLSMQLSDLPKAFELKDYWIKASFSIYLIQRQIKYIGRYLARDIIFPIK